MMLMMRHVPFIFIYVFTLTVITTTITTTPTTTTTTTTSHSSLDSMSSIKTINSISSLNSKSSLSNPLSCCGVSSVRRTEAIQLNAVKQGRLMEEERGGGGGGGDDVVVSNKDVKEGSVDGGQHLLKPVKLKSNQQEMLWIGDLHFDRLYGTKHSYKIPGSSSKCEKQYGEYGCDSPWALISASIKAMESRFPNASLIYLPGDFLRHGSKKLDHPMANLEFVTRQIQQLFGAAKTNSSRVLFTVGNNDFPYDYGLEITSWKTYEQDPEHSNPWFSTWARVLKQNGWLHSAEAVNTFSHGGYYSREFPEDRLIVISLQSIMYSTNFHFGKNEKENERTNDNSNDNDSENDSGTSDPESDSTSDPKSNIIGDPFGQFLWLEQTLKNAKKKKYNVHILTHIPPTIDDFFYKPLWKEHFQERFLQIVKKFRNQVKLVAMGHEHVDSWRMESEWIKDSGLDNFPPFLVTSSVSPVYSNNPSFRRVIVDSKTQEVVNYETYTASIATTNNTGADANATNGAPTDKELKYQLEYSFVDSYNVSDINGESLLQLTQQLLKNETLWYSYLARSVQRVRENANKVHEGEGEGEGEGEAETEANDDSSGDNSKDNDDNEDDEATQIFKGRSALNCEFGSMCHVKQICLMQNMMKKSFHACLDHQQVPEMASPFTTK